MDTSPYIAIILVPAVIGLILLIAAKQTKQPAQRYYKQGYQHAYLGQKIPDRTNYNHEFLRGYDDGLAALNEETGNTEQKAA